MKTKLSTIGILAVVGAAIYTLYAVNVPPPPPEPLTPLRGGVTGVLIGGRSMQNINVAEEQWYRWVPSATTESRLKNVGPHTER